MLGVEKHLNPFEFGPIAKTVSQLNLWIASTYPLQYIKWQVVFMITCATVVLSTSHFFDGSEYAKRIPAFMDYLQIIAGFVFSQFLTKTLYGYTSGIEAYLQFLQRLEHLSRMLAVTRDPRIERTLQGMRALADHAFRPFPSRESLSNLPPEIVGEATTPIQWLLNSQAYIVHCMSDGKRGILAPIASDTLRDIAADVQALERSQMISGPQIMNNHMTYFLILWFGIGIPITMWISLGIGSTIMFYPMVMYALFGPWIARDWLMDAWDPNRPQPESEHEQWPDEFHTRICRGFRLGAIHSQTLNVGAPVEKI